MLYPRFTLLTCGLLLLCALSTPVWAVENIDGSLGKLSSEDRAALLDQMERDLFDGPASRLRDVTKIDKTRICGRLNPKNRMGAYIGYRAFLFDSEHKELILSGDEPDDKAKALVKAACGG
jgi:hypothetical protein